MVEFLAELYLSVLQYEKDLDSDISKIEKLINDYTSRYGVDKKLTIHVDVIAPDFILGKTAFSIDKITPLYTRFKGQVNFDFHLMVGNPDNLIDDLKRLIPDEDKGNHYITIHAEAYRGVFGVNHPKTVDLYQIEEFNEINDKLGDYIAEKLGYIQSLNFKAGIALEPGTDLGNITDKIIANTNLMLLLTVNSGQSGQSFMQSVIPKIKQARERYSGKILIDGGINDEFIYELRTSSLQAMINECVDAVVIGSAITGKEDYLFEARKYLKFLEKK